MPSGVRAMTRLDGAPRRSYHQAFTRSVRAAVARRPAGWVIRIIRAPRRST